jgi:hypothetical protein
MLTRLAEYDRSSLNSAAAVIHADLLPIASLAFPVFDVQAAQPMQEREQIRR